MSGRDELAGSSGTSRPTRPGSGSDAVVDLTDERPRHAGSGASGALVQTTPAAAGVVGELSKIRREPGAAERDPKGSARRWRILEIGLAIAVPVLLIGLWQLAASQAWIDPKLYPSPSTLVQRGRDLFRAEPGGHMGDDVWASVKRILWGYVWGAFFGLLFGVVMGMSRVVRAALDTTLTALYTVPKLALIGVFLLILGFNEKPVIVVIALTVFFFVWIQTMASIMAVAPYYREAAASFGANRWQMFRHVLLPAALPQIFVGLRVAAGVTVLTVIGVEFVYAPSNQGIGFRINNARQILDPAQMYVGIVLASLIGVVFTWIVLFVGRRLSPWARKDEGTPVA